MMSVFTNLRRAVVVALVAVASAAEAAQELDRIVAIVDDDVVTASQLVDRIKVVQENLTESGVDLPEREALINQVLERLIIETIQVSMGERAGVRIPDEALTRVCAQIAEQNGKSLEEFIVELEGDGTDYRDFREQVRGEMIIQRVRDNRVNRRITVSEQEIENFLASPIGAFATADEFRVGHILIAVSSDANDATRAAAAAQAQQVYTRARDGDDFRQLAISNSAGPRALEGGDLGWRRPGQLPTLFADSIVGLQPGETLEPIESGSGYHVVQLLDRRGVSMEVRQEVNVRHILVRPSEIRSEAQAEELINDIYEKLGEGEDFDTLARQYSEDPGSALSGGELGWATTDIFVPEFAMTVDASVEGELSEPFRSDYGWHVLEVLGRREQNMSEELRRRTAVDYLRARRFEEEHEAWLREIRDEAFVELKL